MIPMSEAYFTFVGRLTYFLRSAQRNRTIPLQFRGSQSIKHLAESLGVPHPEVGEVRVNGLESSLKRITEDNDHVEVRPIADGCPVRPRFLLDAHLGRLAAHLRILGFDCLYRNDYEDSELAEIAAMDERILLTRDRRLLMRKAITHGYCLRSLEPLEQTQEVIRRFLLLDRITPFHRCLRCNHPLEPVSKDEILERLELLTKRYFDEFQICPGCHQIYWKGSHYEQMAKLVRQLKGQNWQPGST
jgi:uncharacterized protein with PIN domain